MLKSGLIAGAAMLVLGSILGFVFPLCATCLALFAGAGAGYLSGVFDKPADQGSSAKAGAGAGAIGGVGALMGHVIGGMGLAIINGPQSGANILRQFGVQTDSTSAGTAGFYLGSFITTCCFGLVAVALMAGLGAVGGLLWYQMTSKKSPSLPA